MDTTRTCRNNWVITVERSKDKHQPILRSAVAKRAHLRFEQRGYKHGLDLEDWIVAEKEFLVDDFSGNTSEFRFVIECPGDPEVTTILSRSEEHTSELQSHSDLVCRLLLEKKKKQKKKINL